MYKSFGKRIFDILIAVTGLIVLSPLFLLLIILLWFLNDKKPFFRQQRPGLHGVLFKLIKFRTMTDQRDTNDELLTDKERVTSIGKFLRKTSLDEIPQLWNVLAGEMSLIGPRPLLVEYLPLYNSFQRQRHLVKPGISGWAQVTGRNAITWTNKFEHDIWYVKNLSFLLDIKILYLTAFKQVSSQNTRNKEHIFVEKFKGN